MASKKVGRIFASSGDGSSHDSALTNYYTRRHASVKDDKTRLERDRAERRALQSFAESHGILPDDLHTGLSTLRHYEVNPRKVGDEHWKQSFESLREEEHDETSARTLFERAQRGAAVLERELPTVAARAAETGAIADPKIMRFMAAFADEPAQQK